jgi:hypothetical protein
MSHDIDERDNAQTNKEIFRSDEGVKVKAFMKGLHLVSDYQLTNQS